MNKTVHSSNPQFSVVLYGEHFNELELELTKLGGGGGGANAPKGPTHIKNPKRALENGAFWGLLGPFDPVFLA